MLMKEVILETQTILRIPGFSFLFFFVRNTRRRESKKSYY